MTLYQGIEIVAFALFVGMAIGFRDLIKETREVAKMGGRAFIKDRHDYLTVWQLAHELEGVTPASDAENYAPEILRRVNQIVQGYFRGELALRQPTGYRLFEHRSLLGMLFGKKSDKLWDGVATGQPDVPLLESLYVRRAEFLRFCEQEFIEPPNCWAPVKPEQPTEAPAEEIAEDMRWYKALTELQRRKTACLELARHIWKLDGPISYDAVRTHNLMRQAGLLNVFSPGAFKHAAGNFAPEQVKAGGRPKKSMNYES